MYHAECLLCKVCIRTSTVWLSLRSVLNTYLLIGTRGVTWKCGGLIYVLIPPPGRLKENK
eukprot:TRINITY_DN2521_c0_g1_i1.p3 TRINITY_DN2521_c0_g1~~TRINITY_DN2521_c0_g1_i1.p3  ORF type:complete len:60 (+),score=2.99 TRINITY_DN2521_c0_g1_i1:137-316(+)